MAFVHSALGTPSRGAIAGCLPVVSPQMQFQLASFLGTVLTPCGEANACSLAGGSVFSYIGRLLMDVPLHAVLIAGGGVSRGHSPPVFRSPVMPGAECSANPAGAR